MTRVGHLLFVLLLTTAPGYSQASKPRPSRDTWYEQALRSVSPGNTDYGSIWEQRKQAFIGQLGNRYFQYGFGATVVVMLLLTVTIVQRVSYKRALDVAAQSIADVLRHDEYSRQTAREAIRRYNDHIETCNRVIEAKQEGQTKSTSATEAELQRVTQELADTCEENKALRSELVRKSRTTAATTPGPAVEQAAPVQAEMEFAPAQYIARINALEKQLRAEQRKNQNSKGTSVHDHRA
jgi:hypothetical protein